VNAKRPDFEAALDDLRAGRIDGIAVWKVDRLVRRVSQFAACSTLSNPQEADSSASWKALIRLTLSGDSSMA
jgi:Resolvase, N terminal domain